MEFSDVYTDEIGRSFCAKHRLAHCDRCMLSFIEVNRHAEERAGLREPRSAEEELLDIPEDWHTAAHIPLGYPVLGGHGPISRKPLERMVMRRIRNEIMSPMPPVRAGFHPVRPIEKLPLPRNVPQRPSLTKTLR